MTGLRGRLALLSIVIGLGGAAALADEAAPGRSSDEVSAPELELATRAAKKLDRDEQEWSELTQRLQKAVGQYNPASLNALPEGQSLEAFRDYCKKLRESGRNLLALHDKWGKASEGLDDTLRKAPAYYRAAATVMREKADTMKFAVIKKRYLLSADIWDELAQKAEQRAKDLGLEQGSNKVAELLREELTFLDDFCKTLDALPGLSGGEGGRYAELMAVLRKHTERSDELERQLKLFRDKLKTGPKAGTGSK
jgi:hypothetical protein